MGGSSPERSAADAPGPPSEALSEVWVLLDELPRAAASPVLTATTIEMAAATAADARPASGARSILRRWLAPAAVVATALVGGLVAGRVTAPDPDRRLLEHLPLVRHLDLLREAGSVTFLEEVSGRGGPPLRIALRQGPAAARQDMTERTNALADLDRLLQADAATRRRFVADLPVEERAELDRSLRTFAALSGAERKTIAAVAAALVDATRPELQAAALDWHRWLAFSRPEDRDDIIAASTDKRLDWIDWYAARIEGRLRPGPADRPPGARWPPRGEPAGGPDARFRRPLPPRGEGPEPRDRPERQGPPRAVTPDAAPPPPETRAPPG